MFYNFFPQKLFQTDDGNNSDSTAKSPFAKISPRAFFCVLKARLGLTSLFLCYENKNIFTIISCMTYNRDIKNNLCSKVSWRVMTYDSLFVTPLCYCAFLLVSCRLGNIIVNLWSFWDFFFCEWEHWGGDFWFKINTKDQKWELVLGNI